MESVAGVGEGWNMGSSESVARIGGRLEHGEF